MSPRAVGFLSHLSRLARRHEEVTPLETLLPLAPLANRGLEGMA